MILKICYCLIVIHTLSFCVVNCLNNTNHRFEVSFEWNYINFTWPNSKVYEIFFKSGKYIPSNNAMAGIKYYKEKIYIAIPRIREGIPITFGYISIYDSKINPLITPFPNWNRNELNNCSNLQSVQSMEIDNNGIIWILDGLRINNLTSCPPKLILLDLNKGGRTVVVYEFPEHICLNNGGFLNDIVLDNSDGGFAYITDNSPIDPGLIIFSLKNKNSWKIRDQSMFPEVNTSSFEVDNEKFENLAPIDGIGLSPISLNNSRSVYYCSLAGLNLYRIDTSILKNENKCRGSSWRKKIYFIGQKQAQSDGLIIDNKGNLYYGLLPLYAVGKWNINTPFLESKLLDQNRSLLIWTDSFAFDDKGYLYLLANQIHKFFDPSFKFKNTYETRFRILKLYTSTNSYLYT